MLSRLDPEARKLLLRIPLGAVVALVLWFAGGGEVYGRLLTWATEAVVRLVESPSTTFLTWEDGAIIARRVDLSTRSQLPVFSASTFDWNTVLLFALYLSVPGAGTRRGLLRGLAAHALLLVLQVTHLSLALEDLYARQLGPWSEAAYSRWQRELFATSRYFFDIALVYALPFVIWGILVLVPWARSRAQASADRPAPKPGRRKKRKG